jgi:DNA-directed RNA polymerase subunit RPC12/RpoP
MSLLNGRRKFPCPVCMSPLDVKTTKKDKPYIICDPCGIQLFVRGPLGIGAFNRIIERANRADLWTRLEEMERRFRLKCPECGFCFWIEPDLVETSMFDGSLQGFCCPEKKCGTTVKWGT